MNIARNRWSRWKKVFVYVFIILASGYFFSGEVWSLIGADAGLAGLPGLNDQKDLSDSEGINFIRDIKVVTSADKTELIVTADRSLDAETLIVENKKFVIDVTNANYSVDPQNMNLEDNRLISKIRIGKSNPPEHKVRIVADLKEQVTFNVKKGEKTFSVSMLAKKEMKPAEAKASDEKTLNPKKDQKVEDTSTKSAAKVQAKNKSGVIKETPAVSATPVIKVAAEVVPATAQPVPANIPVSVPVASTAPATVQATAAPVPSSAIPSRFSGKKVSLDFQDADIINVLRLLSEVSKLNMVIGENVKGKLTIRMSDVPWDQALDVVLKLKGLGKVFEDNVLRIDTLANIAQGQDEETRAKEAMVRSEDLETKIVSVNYAKAKDILESVKRSLSPRGDIAVDERTNTLIIKDIKNRHSEIVKFLKMLDTPTPQVLIEARIVQADSNFARDLGVQWGATHNSNPGTYSIGMISGPSGTVGAPATGFAVNLPAVGLAGPKGNLGFTVGKSDSLNLDIRLSAGESQGVTKVLSAPKITTMDNKEATIQQGEAIPYKTLSQEGTKTEFIDATMTLKVTPKVTPDGHIAMSIKISKNRQGSIVVEGTPSINKKEAITEVLVKDGETTVIGGIFESTDVDNVGGVPLFYRIPLIGWLFRNTQKSNIKSELLIFITPKIIPVTI